MSGSDCSMYGSFQIILQRMHKSAKCVFVDLVNKRTVLQQKKKKKKKHVGLSFDCCMLTADLFNHRPPAFDLCLPRP